MGFYRIRKRDDVEPLCPLKKCCCFDLRMATLIGGITIFCTAFIQWVLVLLDQVSWNTDGKFEVPGGFKTQWRRQFWKGFYACNIVMIICHLIIILHTILLIVSILKIFKLYNLHPVLVSWWVIMIPYVLTELGISCYIYSWYGIAGWRLPYLIFLNMFNIIRFILNIMFIILVYSYGAEVYTELHTDFDYQDVDEEPMDYAMGGGMYIQGHDVQA